jgi:hypothetical protein
MSTVGIFGIQFNGWYKSFLPGWFEACLAAQPDQIVLVSDEFHDVPAGVDLVVVDEKPVEHQMAFFANRAIRALWTDWCWPMDVDDLIFPDSVDVMRDVDADVWCCGMRMSNGSEYVPRNMSANWVLASDRNYMNAGSPFRRELCVRVGGYPKVFPPDWGLWRLLAREGARFQCSGHADYFYRMGHESASSRTLTAEDRMAVLAL